MVELNKIFCCDNLSFLGNLENNFAKICITSPPYNVGKNTVYKKNNLKYNNNLDYLDNYYEWLKPRLGEIIRISKYTFFNIQMLSANKLTIIKLLSDYQNYFKDVIIWGKNGQPAMCKGVLNSCFEFIFIFDKETSYKRRFNDVDFRGTVPNLINFGTNNRNKYSKLHRAQFPESLPKFIIENFSKEGDIVCDPFAGLGNVLITAKQMKRNFIGIDIDQEYCDVIEERLKSLTNP